MRTVKSLVALGAVLAAVACSSPRERVSVVESRDFPAASGKLVKIELSSLDVKVKVADTSQIHIEINVSAQASSTAAAKKWVQRHTPTFDDSPEILTVTQSEPRGLFLSAFLHTRGSLDITVPIGCHVEIDTASGDVRAQGPETLKDPLRVRTASGDLTFTGGASELIFRTASGDLRAEGPPLRLLDVETSSGDVRLTAGAAKAVIDTASGDLRLSNLTGDLSVESTSGDVRAGWESMTADATISISTTSGDVSLGLPSGVEPGGELRTSSGTVRCRLQGRWDRPHRRFELGGSAARLSVATTSGDIVVRANH